MVSLMSPEARQGAKSRTWPCRLVARRSAQADDLARRGDSPDPKAKARQKRCPPGTEVPTSAHMQIIQIRTCFGRHRNAKAVEQNGGSERGRSAVDIHIP